MPNAVLDFSFPFQHLIASAQIRTGKGVLHSVVINRPDTLAGSNVALHDVADVGDIAAANMIATIIMDDAFYVIPTTLVYDLEYTTGLYALFSVGMTIGDLTVTYR